MVLLDLDAKLARKKNSEEDVKNYFKGFGRPVHTGILV